MNRSTFTRGTAGKNLSIITIAVIFFGLLAGYFQLAGQTNSGFPPGFDAVHAAPDTHKVIYENALVRVLEVTVPPSGKIIPMHHHRWPSFFLGWDTGGKTPHIRYHKFDGTIKDQPSADSPTHPGKWKVQWMQPEPMHAIEVVENPNPPSASGQPSDLRIEIKVSR
jgi:hypothetical protein